MKFRLPDGDEELEVFTTRPDTLFGATYMVLSPEHPLVREITTPDKKPAWKHINARSARSPTWSAPN